MRAELYQQKELVWDDYTEPSDVDDIPKPPPLPRASFLIRWFCSEWLVVCSRLIVRYPHLYTENLSRSDSLERSHLIAGARARRHPSSSLLQPQPAVNKFSSASSLDDDDGEWD